MLEHCKVFHVVAMAAQLVCFGQEAGPQTNYFLALLPRTQSQGIILPLTNPEHIEIARRHVEDPALMDRTIASVRLVRGFKGINRDYTTSEKVEWPWYVTEVLGFGDSAPGSDQVTSPVRVMDHSEEWFEFAAIGPVYFPGMRVVKELGAHPLWLAYRRGAEEISFWWAELGADFRYVLESAPNAEGPWIPVAGVDWPSTETRLVIPVSSGSALFRVRAMKIPGG